MTSRRLLLLVVGTVVVALATGTGGFSSMTAERDLNAEIAEDDEAYLGVSQETVATTTTTNLTVTVTNRLSSGTELTTVVVTVDGESKSLTEDGPLDAGDSASVEFTDVDCDETIDVHASGSGVAVDLTRDVDC